MGRRSNGKPMMGVTVKISERVWERVKMRVDAKWVHKVTMQSELDSLILAALDSVPVNDPAPLSRQLDKMQATIDALRRELAGMASDPRAHDIPEEEAIRIGRQIAREAGLPTSEDVLPDDDSIPPTDW